ncbi:MAG: hypothetical protein R3250_03345 [Melioribacteraceae bacterium]|nr:hypothetical protein [Melioribacteraceae bacterium]
MNYSLLIDNKDIIPCQDHAEMDVFYTAQTLSKYGGCSVDVYRQQQLIRRYALGKSLKQSLLA